MIKVHTGRVGVALRGAKGTSVVCWPHMAGLKGQDGVVFFRIKPTAKACCICEHLAAAQAAS